MRCLRRIGPVFPSIAGEGLRRAPPWRGRWPWLRRSPCSMRLAPVIAYASVAGRHHEHEHAGHCGARWTCRASLSIPTQHENAHLRPTNGPFRPQYVPGLTAQNPHPGHPCRRAGRRAPAPIKQSPHCHLTTLPGLDFRRPAHRCPLVTVCHRPKYRRGRARGLTQGPLHPLRNQLPAMPMPSGSPTARGPPSRRRPDRSDNRAMAPVGCTKTLARPTASFRRAAAFVAWTTFAILAVRAHRPSIVPVSREVSRCHQHQGFHSAFEWPRRPSARRPLRVALFSISAARRQLRVRVLHRQQATGTSERARFTEPGSTIDLPLRIHQTRTQPQNRDAQEIARRAKIPHHHDEVTTPRKPQPCC